MDSTEAIELVRRLMKVARQQPMEDEACVVLLLSELRMSGLLDRTIFIDAVEEVRDFFERHFRRMAEPPVDSQGNALNPQSLEPHDFQKGPPPVRLGPGGDFTVDWPKESGK